MKRVFSILLAVCMLAAVFVVPASAYKLSQIGLWPSQWHADLNIAFDDATASPLRPLLYEQAHNLSDVTATTAINADLASQISRGALRLTSTTTYSEATRFVRNTLTAEQPNLEDHGLVTENGSTIDLAVKFGDLPKLTDEILKVDSEGNFSTDGISSNARGQLGRYTGLNLNVHSAADYIQEDGTVKVHASGQNKGNPYSTEYNLSFVAYDNEVLGTNAAIIFISGSASGWTSWTGAVREIYFCNLDFGEEAEFHRYTLSTDFSAGAEGEDMVTLYIDGEKATTFTAPAYRGYSATLGDYVTLGLYTNGYCERDENNSVTINVTFDQLSIYGRTLTPSGAEVSAFAEEAPLYTEDYAAALEAAKAIDSTLYSKKSYQAIADTLAEAEKLPAVGEMTKENVTQEALDAITQAINTGIENLRYNDFSAVVDEQRLYIAFAFHDDADPNSYFYSWTNSTTIFTDPDYDISLYAVNGAQLNDFTSVVFEPTEVEGQYEVVAVYPRGTTQDKRTINKAPEGGFIIYTHVNTGVANSTSRYASQIFGDRNAEVISQIQVGDLAVLENVTLNGDAAATLQTNGIWKSRYDPTVEPTTSGEVCDEVLMKYPSSSFTWRDQFDDFETLSSIVMQLPVGAYMDEFNAVKGKIDAAVETDYTADSWKALQDTLATVDLSAESLTQDQIDAWTDALTAAYEALVTLDDPDAEGEGDTVNPGTSEATGDTYTVLITLGVIALLAVGCMTVLVIGRRRGNF